MYGKDKDHADITPTMTHRDVNMMSDMQKCVAFLQAEPVGFEVVAQQSSQAEVTRLFSAMLQLINNGNIQILPAQQAQQPFQLRLVNTQLLHRKFLDGPPVPSQPSKVLDTAALMTPATLMLHFDARTRLQQKTQEVFEVVACGCDSFDRSNLIMVDVHCDMLFQCVLVGAWH